MVDIVLVYTSNSQMKEIETKLNIKMKSKWKLTKYSASQRKSKFLYACKWIQYNMNFVDIGNTW